MLSKYDIFCRVVEYGGFTKAANAISYSQSAVSQTVKNLEQELGLTLLTRGKDGIHLTGDGEAIFPYIQGIAKAEKALLRRQKELPRPHQQRHSYRHLYQCQSQFVAGVDGRFQGPLSGHSFCVGAGGIYHH